MFGKKLTTAITVVVMAAATLFVNAPQANAFGTYRGTVDCGDRAVVGIWVDQGTSSGWADYQFIAGNYRVNWFYTNLRSNVSWRLHVGCGGTPSVWQYNLKTPYMNQTWGDFICLAAKGYCWAS